VLENDLIEKFAPYLCSSCLKSVQRVKLFHVSPVPESSQFHQMRRKDRMAGEGFP
jgi:hypothetical protein